MNKVRYRDLYIYFDYNFNFKDDSIQLESWTAYDKNGYVYEISDADASLEIELKLRNILEDRMELGYFSFDEVKEDKTFDRIGVGLAILLVLMVVISGVGLYLDLAYPLMSDLLRGIMLVATSYYIGRNLVK